MCKPFSEKKRKKRKKDAESRRLFPFDGARGLRGEVVQHAVHARNLRDDALRDVMQQLVRDLLDGGGHRVAGIDGTDDDRPVPAALVVLDTRGLIVGNDGEVLPDLALQAILREFFAQDGVALTQGLQPVARDGAGAADAQAGAGERLTEDHVVGETQLLADDADLVLEEELDGLHEPRCPGRWYPGPGS